MPSQSLVRPAGVGPEALYLTRAGSLALLVADDGQVLLADEAQYLRSEAADGNFAAGADVGNLADGLRGTGDGKKPLHRIGHVGEIPGRIQTSEMHLRFDQGLGDDGGDDRPGRLPGSVGVEGANGGHRELER